MPANLINGHKLQLTKSWRCFVKERSSSYFQTNAGHQTLRQTSDHHRKCKLNFFQDFIAAGKNVTIHSNFWEIECSRVLRFLCLSLSSEEMERVYSAAARGIGRHSPHPHAAKESLAQVFLRKRKMDTAFSLSFFFSVSSKGIAEWPVTIPDTITTWVAQAVGVDRNTGFGMAKPLNLVAFQSFFVSLKLPYSAQRGEQVAITATVFNYGEISLKVRCFQTFVNFSFHCQNPILNAYRHTGLPGSIISLVTRKLTLIDVTERRGIVDLNSQIRSSSSSSPWQPSSSSWSSSSAAAATASSSSLPAPLLLLLLWWWWWWWWWLWSWWWWFWG